MEAFAIESHDGPSRAVDEGRFDNEIVPLNGLTADEGPREPNSLRRSARCPTLRRGRPRHRRGVEPDLRRLGGHAHRLRAAVQDHGLTPRARIHHLSVRADDPIFMLSAPIPATRHALDRPA